MADIVATLTSKNAPVTISNGEKIRIVTLNADGTVKEVLIEDTIGMGRKMEGNVSYGGILSNL